MPPYNMDNSHCCDSLSSSMSSARPLHHTSSSSRPLHHLNHSTSNVETRDELLQLAAVELESMRNPRRPPEKQDSDGSLSSTSSKGSAKGSKLKSSGSDSSVEEAERSFPPACLALLHSLPGNTKCHDCSATSATWASVSYGITLCLQCSGKHRGLGVNCSFIKSLTLDSWKRREILCMLEGGNEQLTTFFDRHGMGSKSEGDISSSPSAGGSIARLDRYRTKAASFYRQHLMSHAKQIAEGGMYKGREASRNSPKSPKKKSSKHGKSLSGKNGSTPKSKRKKSRELEPQLLTVTEKSSESSCSTVGA